MRARSKSYSGFDFAEGGSKYFGLGTQHSYASFYIGLSYVLPGLVVGWNEGLAIGFWPFFLVVCLLASAYCCLLLCSAEMAGLFPLECGGYPICRLTVGPYMGFVHGCMESGGNILLSATLIFYLGRAISSSADSYCDSSSPRRGGNIGDHENCWNNYEPLIWLIVYGISITFHYFDAKISYSLLSGAVISISIAVIVVFSLGSASEISYEDYSGESNEFEKLTISSFMRSFSSVSWFFIGINALPSSLVRITKEAKTNISSVLVWYGYILIPLVIVVLFCVAFQEPGVDKIAGITFPLSNGLSTIFRISTSAANGFSIPVLFDATHSLSITTSHYINGLANSGLLPRYLKQRTTNNVPFFALISCSVVGYTIMVVMWLIQKSTLGHLFNISLLMHWSVSFAVCSGFLSLRYKFSALKRSYNNILGNLSAIYGICVFLLVPISLIGFQRDNQFALVFFLAFTLLLTFYHFYMGRVNQVFSPEEKALMLNAYVIQANVKKRGNIRNNTLISPRGSLVRSNSSLIRSSRSGFDRSWTLRDDLSSMFLKLSNSSRRMIQSKSIISFGSKGKSLSTESPSIPSSRIETTRTIQNGLKSNGSNSPTTLRKLSARVLSFRLSNNSITLTPTSKRKSRSIVVPTNLDTDFTILEHENREGERTPTSNRAVDLQRVPSAALYELKDDDEEFVDETQRMTVRDEFENLETEENCYHDNLLIGSPVNTVPYSADAAYHDDASQNSNRSKNSRVSKASWSVAHNSPQFEPLDSKHPTVLGDTPSNKEHNSELQCQANNGDVDEEISAAVSAMSKSFFGYNIRASRRKASSIVPHSPCNQSLLGRHSPPIVDKYNGDAYDGDEEMVHCSTDRFNSREGYSTRGSAKIKTPPPVDTNADDDMEQTESINYNGNRRRSSDKSNKSFSVNSSSLFTKRANGDLFSTTEDNGKKKRHSSLLIPRSFSVDEQQLPDNVKFKKQRSKSRVSFNMAGNVSQALNLLLPKTDDDFAKYTAEMVSKFLDAKTGGSDSNINTTTNRQTSALRLPIDQLAHSGDSADQSNDEAVPIGGFYYHQGYPVPNDYNI